MPRARRWPEEILPVAADPEARGTAAADGPAVLSALVPQASFAQALAECVASAEKKASGQLEVLCGSESRAAAFAADLEVSGRTAAADGALVRVALEGDGPVAVVHLVIN